MRQHVDLTLPRMGEALRSLSTSLSGSISASVEITGAVTSLAG